MWKRWVTTAFWLSCAGCWGSHAGPSAHEVTSDVGPNRPADTRARGDDQLDPRAVYLVGTLEEGSCNRTAIAKVETPNRALVGFECNEKPTVIDPQTGHALYWSSERSELRTFACDNGCLYWSADMRYPFDPAANDPRLPIDRCDEKASADDARVSPDGARLYHCPGDTWHDENGALVPSDAIDALGANSVAIVGTSLVELTTGERIGHELAELDHRAAVRATDRGFLVVHVAITTSPQDSLELWQVALDGSSNRLGAYPALPDGQTYQGSAKLDANGALYQICGTDQWRTDTVVRRTIAGESTVVYSEADNPLVKLRSDHLMTGP